MFKLHPQHLKDIKAAANHYGSIYFHGDGNIYHREEDSNFRKEFSNNSDGPQTYRVKFSKDGEFPDTLEVLAEMLMKAKNAEAIEKAKPKETAGISTFKTEVDKPVAEKKQKSQAQ